MADPYSGVAITGYNSNPPADDGSETEANRVKWATIKDKLNDPVKERTDSMDTALVAAFGKIDGGVTSTATNYTVLGTDQGKLVRATSAGITITTPDATDVNAPFVFGFLNDTTGDITLDGSGDQTIDGDESLTIPAGSGGRVRTDGSNWFTDGQNFQRTLVEPQGYLTLLDVATFPTSPVPAADQSAKTAVYYRPHKGNLVPIPNGTVFNVREFSELTLTLNSNHVANGIYDVFIFDDDGTIRIGTGTVWNTVTAGSGARGTGAGTTELDLLKGMLVNKVELTMRNGSSTYTVAAKSGLYVGSLSIDGSAGQITCHVTWGQSRKWGVWNAYNRHPILLKGGLGGTWSYNVATLRQSAADATSRVTIFAGLPEEPFDIVSMQTVSPGGTAGASSLIAIGVNSTTGRSGMSAQVTKTDAEASTVHSLVARHVQPPVIGINNINTLENTNGQTTFFGNEEFFILSAKWLG